MREKGAEGTSDQEREIKMGRTATVLNPAKAVPNHHALSVPKTLRGHFLALLHPDPLDLLTGWACPFPASAFLTPDSLHLGISS